MKKILWISRHTMTKEQVNDLKRIFNDDIEVIPYKDTVKSVYELKEPIADVDIIAAVLPIGLMGELLTIAGDKPVLNSVSERRITGKTIISANGTEEPEVEFVHMKWQQMLKVKIITKDL